MDLSQFISNAVNNSNTNDANTKTQSKLWVNFGVTVGETFVSLGGIPVEYPRKGEIALEARVREAFKQKCLTIEEGKNLVEMQGAIALQFVHVGAKTVPADKAQALEQSLSFLK